MVTINDVAKKAQVSKATVSRYINKIGFISEKLQDRISKAIDELDYKPNLIARSLKIQKTNTIGIIYPDIEDLFFSSIIKKIEEVSYDNGYSVILCNTDYDFEKEKVYLEVLKRKQVDGYIIFTTINDRNYLANTLKNENVIFLDRSLDIEGEIFIKLDNIKSIKLAVDYLVSLGHKNIGIIMGPMNITTGIERLKGYKKALEEKNIEPDKNLIKFAGSLVETAKKKCIELLATDPSKKPTAIIATNTTTTMGILMAVKELKTNVPDEISIIGFGDLVYYSLIEPSLTVVTQPLYRFGKVAAETLLGLLEGKKIKRKIIELEPKILVKDSCRRIDQ